MPNNRVFPNGDAFCTESNKPLKHELGVNLMILCCRRPLAQWLISVSYTRDSKFKYNFVQKYITNSVDSTDFIWKNSINWFFFLP